MNGANKKPDWSYQKRLVTDCYKDLITHKKALLAAAPGAGKTEMALQIIETGLAAKTFKRVLVLTHGQILLRQQWADRFKSRGCSAQVEIIASSEQMENSRAPVMIAIPQSIAGAISAGRIDLLIVDEAHHFYRGAMVQKIIELVKPKYQLLLTGSPASFIREGGWKIKGISIEELLDHGVVCDPMFELAESSYKIKWDDFNKNNMELKKGINLGKRETKKTLDALLPQILQKLTSQHRVNPRVFSWAKRTTTWAGLAKNLGKTMIVCHRQGQASAVNNYFSAHEIKASLSISNEDSDSGIEALRVFKEDPDCPFFIVVNRGTLGFDYSELFNIIDMSGTLNPDRLFQLSSRAIRRSNDPLAPRKLILKLTNQELAWSTHITMSYVVALCLKDYYYSGIHAKSVKIPVSKEFDTLLRNREKNGLSGTIPIVNLPKLNTFVDLKKRGTKIDTYAYTDFRTVRALYSDGRKAPFNLEDVLALACECKSRKDFFKNYRSQYSWLTSHGLAKELDKFWPRLTREWTIEGAKKEAKDFAILGKTRESFRKERGRAFKILREEDPAFLERTLPRQLLTLKHKITWHREKAREELIEYKKSGKTRADFENERHSHFLYLLKTDKKLLDEYLPTSKIRWSVQDALLEARRYKKEKKGLTPFRRERSGAYGILLRFALLPELHKILPSSAISWDAKKALQEAKTYARKNKTRTEFAVERAGAYHFLLKNCKGKLDRFFPRKRLGHPYRR